MKTIIFLSLLLLLSCGKKTDLKADNPLEEEGFICSNDLDIVRAKWRSEQDGIVYDLRTCGVSTTCNICFTAFCTGTKDFEMEYYANGEFYMYYFFYGKTVRGEWKVCSDGKLYLDEFTDGSDQETFTK